MAPKKFEREKIETRSQPAIVAEAIMPVIATTPQSAKPAPQAAGSKAVADLIAPAGLDLERINVVLPRQLRIAVERKLLDLDRRVAFSGFVEAAIQEALNGDTEGILTRWNARPRRMA